MQKSFKNILKGTCHIFEGINNILTFGAYHQHIQAPTKNKYALPSLKQTQQNLCSAMNILAKDLRRLTGQDETTSTTLTIQPNTKFLINNRPAIIDYRTHTLKIHQRQ